MGNDLRLRRVAFVLSAIVAPGLAAPSPARADEQPAPAVIVAPKPAPPPAPLMSGEPGWQMGFFGWLELDALYDTTQSFTESVLNNSVARPHTIAGDNPRFQGTPRDSRIGFKVVAPYFGSLRGSAFFEADFFGLLPPNATQDQSYAYGTIRLRQYYARLETPAFDLIVGQTFDLFGWGSYGFFPNTPAFLGVMGEVFHRNPQLRLTTKPLGGELAAVEVAVAGVKPATRDTALPDVQAGARLTFDHWLGASAQGPRLARPAPAALGVSGVGRRMSVTDFNALAADPRVAYGWGAAVDAFIPIIPASATSLSNALSLTLEASTGTGIADLYLTLTGGVLFPSLPNPHNVLPAPTYTPNIDQGIVTYDVDGKLRTIDWQGFMANAHYHLPFREGRMLSISGTFSGVHSPNALKWTPVQGQPFVWSKGFYVDGTLWWSITPSFQMAVSYQRMQQTYGDDTVAVNNRVQAGWWFFF